MTTSLNITVKFKDVYGNRLIYPICDKAKGFADLTNTKTLTQRSIDLIKKLGYEIRVKQDDQDLI